MSISTSSSPVDPLSITTQPQEQINIIPGTHVTFTVGATGSSLDYQWLKEGRKLTEGSKYSGTITAALTVIDVMDSDEGEYLCILGNAVDTVLSMEAVLTTRKYQEFSPCGALLHHAFVAIAKHCITSFIVNVLPFPFQPQSKNLRY